MMECLVKSKIGKKTPRGMVPNRRANIRYKGAANYRIN